MEPRRRIVPPPKYVSRDHKPDWGTGLGCLIIILVFVVLLIFPYFEARHFNSCTGGKATYLDALFTTLRVTECTHEEIDDSTL